MKESNTPNTKSWKIAGSVIGGIIIVCLLICLVGYIALDNSTSSLCGNEVSQEVPSPDNEYKVVVFQRSCGATTGFSTQVSILRVSSQLPNKSGNTFIMDGHPDWTLIEVKWNGNRSVAIEYPDSFEIFHHKNRFCDFLTVIEIKYQVRQVP